MKRRDFITKATIGLGTAMIAPTLLAQQPPAQPHATKPQKPPQFDADLVHDFVAAGHNDLAVVKEMLNVHPNLIYGTWDWGGGDFETALEGSGHMGEIEIANYLIEQGARPNIFVLTMLGKTAIVKPMLEAYPYLLTSKGPHGFTLLHHAERGGEAAAELLEFIKSLGLLEKKLTLY